MRASPRWLDALSLRVETRLDASLPFPATATEFVLAGAAMGLTAILAEARGGTPAVHSTPRTETDVRDGVCVR